MILARTTRLLALCLTVTLVPLPAGFSGLAGIGNANAQWRGENQGRPAPPTYRPPQNGGGNAGGRPPQNNAGNRPPQHNARPPGQQQRPPGNSARPPQGGGGSYRPPQGGGGRPPGGNAGYRPPPGGNYRPPPPQGWGYRRPPGGWGPGGPPVPRAGWGYYRPGWAPPPYGYYYDNTGALLAVGMFGLAAGALAGAAMAQPSAPAPSQQIITSDQIAACARRYRSYDASTGTYLGNDGYRHPCP